MAQSDGDGNFHDIRWPELKTTADFSLPRASQHTRVDEEDEAATAELPIPSTEHGMARIHGTRRKPDELGFELSARFLEREQGGEVK